jgi:aspartyl-tRNA(Asn)/glutamyl-tRNA(Gln) amidotransferase subunit B
MKELTSYKGYEMVIGLEVHCELSTKTKIFCGCKTDFGALPNTQVCPVCMGLPGTLPVLNRKVVEYAVKTGLATHCSIHTDSRQDRKNYFYPDLPKAYQISQYDLPLCYNGWLEIEKEAGNKKIGITRIHIEEDAGKLIHDEKWGTMIDFNRCGVPLLEIVSEPCIASGAEAVAYLKKLRAILLYLGISDCKMNEGSMRCDVNLSVRKMGETELGIRTEMKNLNSFLSVERAIEYEFKRQVDEISMGETITQETRRFDQNTGKTYTMRSKENADDYRYFPDPDLLPIRISSEQLEKWSSEIPTLPDVRKKVYVDSYGLSSYDAERLITDPEKANFFEKAAVLSSYPKLLANLLLSDLPDGVGNLSAPHLASLTNALGDGKINSSTTKKLLAEMVQTDEEPNQLIEKRHLTVIRSEETLLPIVKKAVAENSQAVVDFRKGKTSAVMSVVGKVMAKTDGRADPTLTRKLVLEQFEADT